MVGKKGLSRFSVSNKLAYTLIVVLIIVLIGVGVYAWNFPGSSSTMGHSFGELAPPVTGCLVGQDLTWNGSLWTCQNSSPIPVCAEGQTLQRSILTSPSNALWVCKNFTQMYKCPDNIYPLNLGAGSPLCASFEFRAFPFGSSISAEYCHGQITSESRCYFITKTDYNDCAIELNPINPNDYTYCLPLGISPYCGDHVCSYTDGESCRNCWSDCGICRQSNCGDGYCDPRREDCDVCVADCGVCADVCGDALCTGNEDCLTCEGDCGPCVPVCGDGHCNSGEMCDVCIPDCGACGFFCGDNVCNAGIGENCNTCSIDCGVCNSYCGDGSCNIVDETCSNCEIDCGVCGDVCGDGFCTGGETCNTCSYDCGLCTAVCGDGICNPAYEDCNNCVLDCGSCAGSCSSYLEYSSCAIDSTCVWNWNLGVCEFGILQN